MHVYAAEEVNIRNEQATEAVPGSSPRLEAPAFNRPPTVRIPFDAIPIEWRDQPLPEELQQRLEKLSTVSFRDVRIREEARKFFQDLRFHRTALHAARVRRSPLDQVP